MYDVRGFGQSASNNLLSLMSLGRTTRALLLSKAIIERKDSNILQGGSSMISTLPDYARKPPRAAHAEHSMDESGLPPRLHRTGGLTAHRAKRRCRNISLVFALIVAVGLSSVAGCKKKTTKQDGHPAKSETKVKASEPARKASETNNQPSPDATVQPRPANSGATNASSMHPMTIQLKRNMVRLKFLGWTKDGHRFVIQTTRGRLMGALEGEDQLILREVHDTLTGRLVASFQIKRVTDKDVPKNSRWNRAWREAKPKSEYQAFVAHNPLVNTKPRRVAPASAGRAAGKKLTFDAIGRPPYGTTFEIKATRRGGHYLWTNFDESKKPEDERLLARARSPRVRIRLAGPGIRGSLALLTFSLKHRYQQLMQDMVREIKSFGDVSAFWSPTGDQVVLVITMDTEGTNDEVPEDGARYYIRAIGPQYRLIASNGAENEARALAWKLGALGLPPTDLALRQSPIPATMVQYWGKDGKTLADKLAAALPGPETLNHHKGRSWLQAKVQLGPQALGR